jgi:hypothetical protein
MRKPLFSFCFQFGGVYGGTVPSWQTGQIQKLLWLNCKIGSMTTIRISRTAHLATCRQRCSGRKDRLIEHTGASILQGQDHEDT